MIHRIFQAFDEGFQYGVGYLIGTAGGAVYNGRYFILAAVVSFILLKLVNRKRARTRISNR